MLKAHLVNNETLAQICQRKGLMESLRAAPSTLYTIKGQTKTQASVFEAFVAGVYYDFIKSPTPGGYSDDSLAIAATVDDESMGDDANQYGMVANEVGGNTWPTFATSQALTPVHSPSHPPAPARRPGPAHQRPGHGLRRALLPPCVHPRRPLRR